MTATMLGACEMEGCRLQAVIVCRFQSLAGRRADTAVVRVERQVVQSFCWPHFAGWTDNLRTLSRRGIGLDEWQEGVDPFSG
jgi:hypothetical protein